MRKQTVPLFFLLWLSVAASVAWIRGAQEPGKAKPVETAAGLTVARSHYHAYHILAPVVAQEKGFFGNLPVKILPRELKKDTADGNDLLSQMQAEGINIMADARTRVVFTHDQKRGRIYALGGWLQGGNDTAKIVAVKTIQSLADFRGKRIGTTVRDAENTITLTYWLRRSGIDPDRDLTWVLGLSRNNANAKALREGRIDIGFVSEEETPALVREGYNVVMDYKKMYPEGRPERVIVAAADLVENHPETVKNFLKAMVRSYRLINDWRKNDDFLKPVWTRVASWAKDDLGEHYQDTPLLPDAMISLKGLQSMLDEEKESGRAAKDLRLEAVVNLKLLEQALAELKRENVRY